MKHWFRQWRLTLERNLCKSAWFDEMCMRSSIFASDLFHNMHSRAWLLHSSELLNHVHKFCAFRRYLILLSERHYKIYLHQVKNHSGLQSMTLQWWGHHKETSSDVWVCVSGFPSAQQTRPMTKCLPSSPATLSMKPWSAMLFSVPRPRLWVTSLLDFYLCGVSASADSRVFLELLHL